MKKLSRTGIIFLVLHTLLFTYMISILNRGASGDVFKSWGLLVGQLPFLTIIVALATPLWRIAEKPFFIYCVFYILGGFQWYLMGWIASVLFNKAAWKK